MAVPRFGYIAAVEDFVDGVPGEGATALDPVDALLANGRDERAVDAERGTGVVVVVDTEDDHSAEV